MRVNFTSYASLSALLTAVLFLGFHSDAQSQSFGSEGQLLNIGGVGYIPPKGWSVSQSGDAVVLTGPAPQQLQPCLIAIDPTVKPSGDMAAQLETIVNDSFGRQFGPYHGETGSITPTRGAGVDVKADQYQGVAAAGWPYVDLFGQLGSSPLHVRALLARFNERAVAVVGLFKAGLDANYHPFEDCLGNFTERNNDVFLMVFHSLRLPGFSGVSPEFTKRVQGSWMKVSSGVGVRVTYAANGHFDDGGAVAAYYQSGNLIYDTTKNFMGAGTYRLDGDRLTMTRKSGSSRTVLVSVVRRPSRDRPGEYDEILRQVEQTDNQVRGFGRTGYFVMSYNRSQ
jgi:hypothetical protein